MSAPSPQTERDSPGAASVTQHLPAVLLAILCGVVFYEAATTLTEQGYASGTPISNAALYPRLLAGLLLFLLALQVLSDIRSSAARGDAEAPAEPGQKKQTVFAALGLVCYILLLPVLGFLAATPIFVLGLLLLLGDRQLATVISVPLGVTAGCVVVFQILFNVNLPRGVLGIALNV